MYVRFAVFALASTLLAQPIAAAKIVKWTDEAGQVHYGSAPPPGAAKQGTQTLNEHGMVIETKAGQVQATQQAEQKKIEAAKQRAEEKQAIADQRLIDSYASEADLVRAYEQNIELIDQQVTTTKSDLANRQTSLDKLVARAADMERTGKPVNEQLKQMIVSERTQIGVQQEYMNAKIKSKLTAKTQFDLNVQRYREVLKRAAARQAGTAIK
jgi:vancomycin resistance protein YoaR